jgi:exopolysaccharide production protein ExoY
MNLCYFSTIVFFQIIEDTKMELQNYDTVVSSRCTFEQVLPYLTSNHIDLEAVIDYKKQYIFLKRIFDIFASFILIILLLPFMLIVCGLIFLITKENGIYTQTRIGLNEKKFVIYKFRTMKSKLVFSEYEKLIKFNESQGILLKTSNDPRLYAFGKFLRKTSIDELPQLFNVLIGDMSLVGPRPLLEYLIAPFPEICKSRSLVKPGITGLWQTSARCNNTSVLQMINYDTEYIRNFSLLSDIKILIKTIGVVIKCKDAV